MHDPEQIDVNTAKKLLDEKAAMFIDVRDPRSYAAAHIPGATHLNDGNVESFVQDTPKTAKVVVYCYHGFASQGAAEYLRDRGFADVVSMAGGFETWRFQFETEPAR